MFGHRITWVWQWRDWGKVEMQNKLEMLGHKLIWVR